MVFQELLFDIIIIISYLLIIISSLGISVSAPKLLDILDYYIRVYICLFLIWRFNPFRNHYQFTNLDRKIAFNAGMLILTTSIITNYRDMISIAASSAIDAIEML
jgi:hypothetical protein